MAPRVRRVCVRAAEPCAPLSSSSLLASLWSTLLAALLFVAVGVAASNSSSSSSSTGSGGNSTAPLSDDDDDDDLPSLPVSNQVAIGLVCGGVLALCLCMFVCARTQMKAGRSKKPSPGAGLSPAMQARLAAVRRGWRKSDATGQSVDYSGGARGPAGSKEAAQRAAMIHLSGASLGGLGACRYDHFLPDDFVAEADTWATPGNLEALRRSGCILDVVISARATMFLAGMTAWVPLIVVGLLPFHKMLLKKMKLRDWYGAMEEVEFERCIAIAGAALVFHVLVAAWARRVYTWDRAPSVAREKAAQKDAARFEAQKTALAVAMGQAPPVTVAIGGGGGGAMTGPASPSATALTPVVPFHSPTAGGALIVRTYTMSTQPPSRPTGTMLKQLGHTLPPTTPVAAPLAPVSVVASSPSSGAAGTTAPLPTVSTSLPPAPVVLGDDPPRWPLALLCVAGLLSYGLLGFQGYLSLDESFGRRYEWTDTPSALWPAQKPRAPEITLLVCFVLGTAALVPLAFSLRLLALFTPRKVHPHLLIYKD